MPRKPARHEAQPRVSHGNQRDIQRIDAGAGHAADNQPFTRAPSAPGWREYHASKIVPTTEVGSGDATELPTEPRPSESGQDVPIAFACGRRGMVVPAAFATIHSDLVSPATPLPDGRGSARRRLLSDRADIELHGVPQLDLSADGVCVKQSLCFCNHRLVAWIADGRHIGRRPQPAQQTTEVDALQVVE